MYIQVRVTSGHAVHSWESLSSQVIIVSVHKTVTALTHCTTSVQRLLCLHTVWPRLKSLLFRKNSRWTGFLNLPMVLYYSSFVAMTQKKGWFHKLALRSTNCATWLLMSTCSFSCRTFAIRKHRVRTVEVLKQWSLVPEHKINTEDMLFPSLTRRAILAVSCSLI